MWEGRVAIVLRSYLDLAYAVEKTPRKAWHAAREALRHSDVDTWKHQKRYLTVRILHPENIVTKWGSGGDRYTPTR